MFLPPLWAKQGVGVARRLGRTPTIRSEDPEQGWRALVPLPPESRDGFSPHLVWGLVPFLKCKPTEESRWKSLRIVLLKLCTKVALGPGLTLAFREPVSPFVKQGSRRDDPLGGSCSMALRAFAPISCRVLGLHTAPLNRLALQSMVPCAQGAGPFPWDRGALVQFLVP